MIYYVSIFLLKNTKIFDLKHFPNIYFATFIKWLKKMVLFQWIKELTLTNMLTNVNFSNESQLRSQWESTWEVIVKKKAHEKLCHLNRIEWKSQLIFKYKFFISIVPQSFLNSSSIVYKSYLYGISFVAPFFQIWFCLKFKKWTITKKCNDFKKINLLIIFKNIYNTISL